MGKNKSLSSHTSTYQMHQIHVVFQLNPALPLQQQLELLRRDLIPIFFPTCFPVDHVSRKESITRTRERRNGIIGCCTGGAAGR